MRSVIAAAVLLVSGAWSVDPSRRPRALTDEERGLTVKEIAHHSDVYRPEIRACYAAWAQGPRASGKLELSGTVLRNGNVIELVIRAPGVTGTDRAMLDQCVRQSVDKWHFPARLDPTQFVIPYYFQKLGGPGPQYSCWNPHGCRTKQGKR